MGSVSTTEECALGRLAPQAKYATNMSVKYDDTPNHQLPIMLQCHEAVKGDEAVLAEGGACGGVQQLFRMGTTGCFRESLKYDVRRPVPLCPHARQRARAGEATFARGGAPLLGQRRAS